MRGRRIPDTLRVFFYVEIDLGAMRRRRMVLSSKMLLPPLLLRGGLCFAFIQCLCLSGPKEPLEEVV